MKNVNEPIFLFPLFLLIIYRSGKKEKTKNGKKGFTRSSGKNSINEFSTRTFTRYELTRWPLAGCAGTLDSLAPSFGPDRGSAVGLAPVEFHSLNSKQLIERIERALQPATTAPEQSAKLQKFSRAERQKYGVCLPL